MRSLIAAQERCEAFLPGLLNALHEVPLATLEQPGGVGLDLFRKFGGSALLIPKTYGGLGANPFDALQVQRAIGAASPSLAVATAMHHFSVATIFTLADSLKSSGLEWALLEGIADQRLLVASAFAEGQPGRAVLDAAMVGVPTQGGVLVTGSKKPCSMARSMDLLSASAVVQHSDGSRHKAVLLLPANTPGISVHDFWGSSILAGAESDEVRLTDVFVDESLLVPVEEDAEGRLDELQTVGFIWFEMLIAAGYLGMASWLVERTLARKQVSEGARSELTIRLESATRLLESIAYQIQEGQNDNPSLAQTVATRYAAEDAITEAAQQSTSMLGGLAFISEPDISYYTSACQCVRFHPPSRDRSHRGLLDSASGQVFTLR